MTVAHILEALLEAAKTTKCACANKGKILKKYDRKMGVWICTKCRKER